MSIDSSAVAALMAQRVDFALSGHEALEEYFVRSTGTAVLTNPSLGISAQNEYLGIGTRRVTLSRDDLEAMLFTFVLDEIQREHLFSHERRVGAWMSFLAYQPASRRDVTRILNMHLGDRVTQYILERPVQFALKGRPGLSELLDHASPLTQLEWLARSKRGTFNEHARSWLGRLNDAQRTCVAGRDALSLLVQARGDLIDDLLAACPRAHEVAARSARLTRDQQLLVAGLPFAGAYSVASYNEWLATYEASIEALLANRSVNRGVLTDIATHMERFAPWAWGSDRPSSTGAALYWAVRRANQPKIPTRRSTLESERQHVRHLRSVVSADALGPSPTATDVQARRSQECDGRCRHLNCGKAYCSSARRSHFHEKSVDTFYELLKSEPGAGPGWCQGNPASEWLLSQLGTSPNYWQRFFALCGDWNGSMGALVEVVANLEATEHRAS
jgi:hypothetical protein